MNSEFIVSILGPDRLELIKPTVERLHDLGGELLSSRLINLDGQLAALLKINLAADKQPQLQALLEQDPELCVQISPVGSSSGEHEQSLSIHIQAKDQLGLINHITNKLLSLGGFISHMECNRISVLEIGGNLLSIHMALRLPTGVNPQQLTSKLDELDEDIVVNIVS